MILVSVGIQACLWQLNRYTSIFTSYYWQSPLTPKHVRHLIAGQVLYKAWALLLLEHHKSWKTQQKYSRLKGINYSYLPINSLQPDTLHHRSAGGRAAPHSAHRRRRLVLPRQQDHHPQELPQQLQRQKLYQPFLQPGGHHESSAAGLNGNRVLASTFWPLWHFLVNILK